MAGDCRLVIEAIATYYIDRALEHEPDRGMTLADVEDDFTGCEIVCWPACEALRNVELARIEHRKQLVATSLDNAHLSLSGPNRSHFSILAWARTNSNCRGLPLVMDGRLWHRAEELDSARLRATWCRLGA